MGDFARLVDSLAYRLEEILRGPVTASRRFPDPRMGQSDGRFERSLGLRVDIPERLSEFATDGSCTMRHLLAYLLKGVAILDGFGGLVTVVVSGIGFEEANIKQICVGLLMICTAQMLWLAGRLLQRSADRKRYAQHQHRLLKLARQKDGRLTVLEAATDSRMTVEKAEEILRELALLGHAELRVSDSGIMVYHFPEIEHWEEKQWARPVDEL